MDTERRSELLFGRYQALGVYRAIAGFAKAEFTTGQLARASDAPVAACSKELARLEQLGLVVRRSRKGDYERCDGDLFWEVIERLAVAWETS